MGKNRWKQPATRDVPAEQGKQPRYDVTDPQIHSEQKLVWRFGIVDLGGPFGWGELGRFELLDILASLQQYESMTWNEIDQKKSCHATRVKDIDKVAYDRLVHLGLDDEEKLYQIRVNSTGRVWGIRDRNIFKLIWWDPDHKVWPTSPPNT